ncbi:LLM class F420-dependent oxidoreductase [Kineococcus sp. NBC_00420]|uniref:LLM class F420-dependent oxidoreductase n=1 Tax=unclassified Kineococcus TaxID=2621656 RepID=UPI002E205166
MTADPRPVRIGIQIQPQHAQYPAIRAAAARAEEMGADIAFNWDHFYPLYGEPEGLHFEAWTMLAAWAEATSRIEIGALVSCNSYRNPELLADMARTVDHVSAHDTGSGRLILGIGSGWFEKDYDEYGYEFGTAGGRLNKLRDDMPRIESRLAKLNPAPTRKVPVLIGGGGEQKTLRIVAKHADIWHSFGDVETFTRKSGILDERCAEIGRDPLEIERSVGVEPKDGVEAAEALHAAGGRLFTFGTGGPDYDMGFLAELIAWRDSKNA